MEAEALSQSSASQRYCAAAQRAWTLGRCALGVITCVGIPIATVVVLLFGDGTGQVATSMRVRVHADPMGGATSTKSNVTCARNVTATVTVDPAGETTDEGMILDGALDTPWCVAMPPHAAARLGNKAQRMKWL